MTGFAATPKALLYDRSLSPTAKLVYTVLSSHADEDGAAWPSHQVLADESGLSEKTVREKLNELRGHGYVRWEVRATSSGGKTSHLYQLDDRFGSTTPRSSSSAPTGSGYRSPPVTTTDPPPLVVTDPHRNPVPIPSVAITDEQKSMNNKTLSAPAAQNPTSEGTGRKGAHVRGDDQASVAQANGAPATPNSTAGVGYVDAILGRLVPTVRSKVDDRARSYLADQVVALGLSATWTAAELAERCAREPLDRARSPAAVLGRQVLPRIAEEGPGPGAARRQAAAVECARRAADAEAAAAIDAARRRRDEERSELARRLFPEHPRLFARACAASRSAMISPIDKAARGVALNTLDRALTAHPEDDAVTALTRLLDEHDASDAMYTAAAAASAAGLDAMVKAVRAVMWSVQSDTNASGAA